MTVALQPEAQTPTASAPAEEEETLWVHRVAGAAATLALRLHATQATVAAALSHPSPAPGSLGEGVGAVALLCEVAHRLRVAGGAEGGGWIAPVPSDLDVAAGGAAGSRLLGGDARAAAVS